MTNKNNQPPKIGTKQVRLLSQLSNACAVSGDEGAVRDLVLREVRPYADKIEIDAIGNLLVTCEGTKRSRLRVMLAAHMDEVGFMLTHHDGDGVIGSDVGVNNETLHVIGPFLTGGPFVFGTSIAHPPCKAKRPPLMDVLSSLPWSPLARSGAFQKKAAFKCVFGLAPIGNTLAVSADGFSRR